MRTHGASQQLVVDDAETGELGDGASHVGSKQDAPDHPRGDIDHLRVKIDAAALCGHDLPAFHEAFCLFDHDVDVIAGDAAPCEDWREESPLSVPAFVLAGEHVVA
jgi:hypothetical protein